MHAETAIPALVMYPTDAIYPRGRRRRPRRLFSSPQGRHCSDQGLQAERLPRSHEGARRAEEMARQEGRMHQRLDDARSVSFFPYESYEFMNPRIEETSPSKGCPSEN